MIISDNIDFPLLKQQQLSLLKLWNKLSEEDPRGNKKYLQAIDGIMNFIDHIRDAHEGKIVATA